MARVYLDHASRWPLRPEARQAWLDATDLARGDPARTHAEGRASQQLLDRATTSTAAVLGAASDAVVWTASGTEAIHLAVHGAARAAERRGEPRGHLVACAVEHSAVLRALERLRDDQGYELDVVDVDRSGTVDPERVAARVRDDTLSVHVQHANHEVGTMQPTHDVAAACRERGALLHVDACQTVGQVGVTLDQLGADLLSASAGKFGGPPGVGLLAVGPRGRVAAMLEGDHRQRRRRAGSEDVAGIAAAAVALQVAGDRQQEERSHREILRRRLRQRLPEVAADVEVHGPLAEAHPGIVAASALYVDGDALTRSLDERGFAVHSGSACASWSEEPSHVLVAMGALTHGHVRVSVGPETSSDDVEAFLVAYGEVVGDLRRRVGR